MGQVLDEMPAQEEFEVGEEIDKQHVNLNGREQSSDHTHRPLDESGEGVAPAQQLTHLGKHRLIDLVTLEDVARLAEL